MSDLWMVREGLALRPFGSESAAVFGKIGFKQPVYVEVRQPRNGPHHRLFWTMCARMAGAIGCEAEDICHILKVRTGHVRQIRTKRGVEEIPLSISFAKMDQIAFKAFFDKCLHVIETEFGIVRPDVLAALGDLLEPEAA